MEGKQQLPDEFNDLKFISAYLRELYPAPTKKEAEEAIEAFDEVLIKFKPVIEFCEKEISFWKGKARHEK